MIGATSQPFSRSVPAHLFHVTALVGAGWISLTKYHSCVLSPSEEPKKICSVTQQCLADGVGGISLGYMGFVARKLSYKVLQGWGDSQARGLFAIYSFPLAVCDWCEFRAAENPRRASSMDMASSGISLSLGCSQFWDDSSLLGWEARPPPFNCIKLHLTAWRRMERSLPREYECLLRSHRKEHSYL